MDPDHNPILEVAPRSPAFIGVTALVTSVAFLVGAYLRSSLMEALGWAPAPEGPYPGYYETHERISPWISVGIAAVAFAFFSDVGVRCIVGIVRGKGKGRAVFHPWWR